MSPISHQRPKPRDHGLFSFFLPLFCISQLERAREHQPGTSDSAGKSLFASAVRYLGISPFSVSSSHLVAGSHFQAATHNAEGCGAPYFCFVSPLSHGYLTAISRQSHGYLTVLSRLSHGYLSFISRLSCGYPFLFFWTTQETKRPLPCTYACTVQSAKQSVAEEWHSSHRQSALFERRCISRCDARDRRRSRKAERARRARGERGAAAA